MQDVRDFEKRVLYYLHGPVLLITQLIGKLMKWMYLMPNIISIYYGQLKFNLDYIYSTSSVNVKCSILSPFPLVFFMSMSMFDDVQLQLQGFKKLAVVATQIG